MAERRTDGMDPTALTTEQAARLLGVNRTRVRTRAHTRARAPAHARA